MNELIMDGSEIKRKIELEIERYEKFRYGVLGMKESDEKAEGKLDYKKYARYILAQGSIDEKRELLSCLKDKLTLSNGKINIFKWSKIIFNELLKENS